ncbi:MAG: MoaD/ThiS family protein [Peptococcaceae bacterium]|jgi:sulfur carrier protein ThiS|nr:MoaD/ThiS family protein [Peptococcaceae bacterium]MDH7526270.1 MoaD/ThiS family protein [Peptococcaceae bacterium]
MAVFRFNLTLIKAAGQKELVVSLGEPAALTELLEKIGIAPGEVGIVIKNGKWAPVDCLVEENDNIELFPVLQGG